MSIKTFWSRECLKSPTVETSKDVDLETLPKLANNRLRTEARSHEIGFVRPSTISTATPSAVPWCVM
jgi:hypothetical protein